MRADSRAVAGLAAVGLVVCCGLPVLLTVAAGVTFAGVALRSWLLALAGLTLAASGLVWRRSRRSEPRRTRVKPD